MPHLIVWGPRFWASIPWKNVHTPCSLLLPLTGTMRRNECLISCLMHGNILLRPRCGQGSLIIACISPLFFLSPLFSWLQWCLAPLKQSCQLLARNTKCSPQFLDPLNSLFVKLWCVILGEICLGFCLNLFWLWWVRASLNFSRYDVTVLLQFLVGIPRHWYVNSPPCLNPIELDPKI